ncbi:MAG: DUF2156 domain-containing protein [Oscillospiraceae bacterium]|nr:DUF2156 domain-containing protein [Oscillospiraceae bacterium]
MISFHTPVLTDKPWIDDVLRTSGVRGCEYNFTNLFAWSDPYCQQVAQVEGCLAVHVTGSMGGCYLYPVGGDERAAVAELRQDAAERDETFRMVCVLPEQRERLEGWFSGCFAFEADRDGFDYLYDIERLCSLTGKKLHGKRNHINRFLEDNPQWSFEPITAANLTECIAMDERWYQENLGYDGDETLREDGVALRKCMAHYDRMGLEGCLLRAGGRVVAFTMGEPMGESDTYDVHFEKAFSEVQGAYPMVNREFARWVRERHPNIRYLNREDDMGVEGLRKAKESYYPDILLEKYSAVWQKEMS